MQLASIAPGGGTLILRPVERSRRLYLNFEAAPVRMPPAWHATEMPRHPTRVDLVHRDDRLTGLIFGIPVDVPLDIPDSNSATSGTYGEVLLAAKWKIASNYNSSEQPASLVATFGDQSVELTTTFMFLNDQNPTLVGATIVGNFGGDPVDVRVAPVHDPHEDFVIERIISVDGDPEHPDVVYKQGIVIGPIPAPSLAGTTGSRSTA